MALRVSEEEFRGFLLKQGKGLPATAPPMPQKRSKYGNRRIVVDGERFDSKGEYARYLELLLQQKAGLIRDLTRQVRIPIEVNGSHICDYIADFVYYEKGEEVVEDFKGMVTGIFALKRKLLAATQGKEVRITKAK